MVVEKIVVVYGGELARDVGEQFAAKKPAHLDEVVVTVRNASEKPKTLVELGPEVLVCFFIQTIENASPTEDGGTCLRFFKRKSHPEDLLKGKFAYAVFGLGDSNLLLDRQTTTAKDCNQCADQLDSRLEALGGRRHHDIGIADERTGLQEVEPWIESLWKSVDG